MPIDALSVLCAQLTSDLLAIAKFLFVQRYCFSHLIITYFLLTYILRIPR